MKLDLDALEAFHAAGKNVHPLDWGSNDAIAEVYDALPALIARVRELEGENSRLREQFELSLADRTKPMEQFMAEMREQKEGGAS